MLSLSVALCLPAVALLVFLAAAAGTRVIPADFFGYPANRSSPDFFSAAVGGNIFSNLFSFQFFPRHNPVQHLHGVFLNTFNRFVKHFKTDKLVLNQRILLSKRAQTNALPHLIHVVDMIHPLLVNHLQQQNPFRFPELFNIVKLLLFLLIELMRFFF